jgi:hypothetical protein
MAGGGVGGGVGARPRNRSTGATAAVAAHHHHHNHPPTRHHYHHRAHHHAFVDDTQIPAPSPGAASARGHATGTSRGSAARNVQTNSRSTPPTTTNNNSNAANGTSNTSDNTNRLNTGNHQPSAVVAAAAAEAAQVAARSLTPEEIETGSMILFQLEPQRRTTAPESPAQIVQRLSAALSNQVFNASFSGNLRVLQGVFSLPQRLLQAVKVQASMQQPGSLLQPLHMASYNGQISIVRFLLGQPGVSVNVAAADHDSPLHKACYNAHSQVAQVLLEAGADANASTPLSIENPPDSTHRHLQARPQLRNGLRTPMHYAVFNHELPPSDARTECVRSLLKKVHIPTHKWIYTDIYVDFY